jgi:hypothetical protein
MKNDKTGRILIGVFIQMTVLALLTVTAVAQTSTTTRTIGTATNDQTGKRNNSVRRRKHRCGSNV